MDLAPRLRFENQGNGNTDLGNDGFYLWMNENFESLSKIYESTKSQEISEDISIFANSHLHDSEISKISISEHQILISINCASSECKMKIRLFGDILIYSNPEQEFSILDTRINILDNSEKLLHIWLGHSGYFSVKYTGFKFLYKRGKEFIDLNTLKNNQEYGSTIITRENFKETLEYIDSLRKKSKR